MYRFHIANQLFYIHQISPQTPAAAAPLTFYYPYFVFLIRYSLIGGMKLLTSSALLF